MNGGDLTAWAAVRDILKLDDDREQDTSFLIASASRQAETIACRMLAARDVTLRLDARGGRELLLPSWPVNIVYRLCVDTLREFPPEKDMLPEQYGVQADSGIIRLYNREFPAAFDCVLFSGNIGYRETPEDLQQAVIETVSYNLRRFGARGGQVGIKSLSEGGAVTTAYEIDLPMSARNIFISYRGARI